MHYPNVTSAVFLSRPNRFVAQVLLEGEVITVHVKNTCLLYTSGFPLKVPEAGTPQAMTSRRPTTAPKEMCIRDRVIDVQKTYPLFRLVYHNSCEKGMSLWGSVP